MLLLVSRLVGMYEFVESFVAVFVAGVLFEFFAVEVAVVVGRTVD